MSFEIGEKITWSVGNTTCRGLVREIFDDTLDVICYEINNKPTRSKITLHLENLTIYKDEYTQN
jgi:hypothetical protein